MKKKVFSQLLALWLILPVGLTQAFTYQPVSSLSGWYSEGEWVFSGNAATVTNAGGWAILRGNYQNSVGLRATINLGSIVGFSGCGICKTVGTVGDHTVRACVDIGYGGWDGEGEISYYIALIDPEGYWSNTYEVGYLGEFELLTGRDITVEIARSGNEIWFTVPGYGVSKFAPTINLGEMADNVQFDVENLTPGSRITTTIKDVSVVYPD